MEVDGKVGEKEARHGDRDQPVGRREGLVRQLGVASEAEDGSR